MDYHPFTPWVKRDSLTPGQQADLDARPESPLDSLGLTKYADLYAALRGFLTPAQADECELWQIVAVLGRHRRVESDDPIDRLADRIETEKEALARRAAKLSNPQPEVEPSGGPVDMTEQIMRNMGIVTR